MSEFKIGDKCYYFWHANDCSLVWQLSDFILAEDEIIGFNYQGKPMFTGHYEFSPERDGIFKSKSQAIDAMIKRLEEMKEEEHEG